MRMIDKDALMDDIATTIENSGCVNHEKEILDCVEFADTIDAVPVVRCKDCKYFAVYQTRRNGQTMQFCMRMAKHDMEYHINPDDYCSYGAKMEGKP